MVLFIVAVKLTRCVGCTDFLILFQCLTLPSALLSSTHHRPFYRLLLTPLDLTMTLETTSTTKTITIGVLALQGAFIEHISHLKHAVKVLQGRSTGDNNGNIGETSTVPVISPSTEVRVIEVRTPQQLSECDGLVIPGGESTAISLVAERTGMLAPLREYIHQTTVTPEGTGRAAVKAVWGTCAGLILVANEISGARRGQQLLGGLDVHVARNHFGSQLDSFTTTLAIPALTELGEDSAGEFKTVFIRAPVVESINISTDKPTVYVSAKPAAAANDFKNTVVAAPAPTKEWAEFQTQNKIEVLATLPASEKTGGAELCVAVRQGRILGTSFHPELTEDSRIHQWWIKKCVLQL